MIEHGNSSVKRLLFLHMFLVVLLSLVAVRAYTVTFIADPHYDPLYKEDSNPNESCRTGGGAAPNITYPYGQYRCGAVDKALDVLVNALRQTTKTSNISFMIGDVILGKHTTREEHDQAIEDLYNKVRSGVAGPLYPVLGNTEFYGISQSSTNEEILSQIKKLAELTGLENISSTAYKQFLKGGYYSVRDGRLKFLVLNTGLYNALQKRTEDDPLGQLAFVRAELEDCRKSKCRVAIIQHIPLMMSTYTGAYTMQQRYSDALRHLYCEYYDVVANIHAAEDHRDEFKLIYCQDNNSGIPLFMLPAISPNRYNNPGYRQVELSPKTGNLMDYVQYYLDLGLANIKTRTENVYTRHRTGHNAPTVNYSLEYRFSDEYGPSIMRHLDDQKLIVATMKTEGWGTYVPMRALYIALQNDPGVWSVFHSHMSSLCYDKKTSFICAARAITIESYKSCLAKLQ